MKTARRCLFLLLASLLPVVGMGCGDSGGDGGYNIYYLNKEASKILPSPYEPAAKEGDSRGLIEELLTQLLTNSKDVELKKPVPDDVKVLKYTLEEALLTIYFSEEYGSMDKIEEVLARAAFVRTMTQVEGVECLSFFVGDLPLTDGKGNPVGVMANDSFIENPGEQINSIQEAALTLYFSNKKGDALVSETRQVHYSSNISLEKLVMEHLLEGPKGSDALSAIPEGTKLMNVSVLDGVCYVSLDANFLNQNYNIDEPVVLYSIVNSLSELPTISKVQISVNGDTNSVYRDKFRLDELYERNLDYMEAKQ